MATVDQVLRFSQQRDMVNPTLAYIALAYVTFAYVTPTIHHVFLHPYHIQRPLAMGCGD